MACLSWRRDGGKGFTVLANPIYPLSNLSDAALDHIEFEILEADAGGLAEEAGVTYVFYIDDQIGVFSGKLSPLVPVVSTHPSLAVLRDRQTLRGSLDIISREPLAP